MLDHARRELIVVTSGTKRSGDFVALLGRLDRAYGPAPGREDRPVVLVLDNGPIHTSKARRQALAARPWLTVEWLPKYAPELNDIERSWRDLKRHYLAHRTFRDADELDPAIHQAVDALNRERRPQRAPSSPRLLSRRPAVRLAARLFVAQGRPAADRATTTLPCPAASRRVERRHAAGRGLAFPGLIIDNRARFVCDPTDGIPGPA